MWFKRLAIAIPPLAILLSGWLPFVNETSLWFGLPSLIVWIGIWCLVTAPILWTALGMYTDDDEVDAAEVQS